MIMIMIADADVVLNFGLMAVKHAPILAYQYCSVTVTMHVPSQERRSARKL